MEADQTGFSSSSSSGVAGVPAAAGSTTCSDETEDSTPPTPNNRVISVKEEPDEDTATVVVTTNTAPLPSISEENWRNYYNQPLVVLNGGTEDAAIYEYKLPSLAKFGKGLVGKLPAAIWSVVQQPETELITPNHHDPPTPSPPVSSPIPMVQDLTTPLYLHRQVDKVIVQQADHREETVIQPVPDDKAQDKDVTGVVVETVKATDDDGNPIRQRDIQAETSHADLPLEGASYPNSDFSPNSYESLGTGQYSVLTNVVVTVAPPQYGTQTTTVGNVYTLATGDYYREYYAAAQSNDQYAQAVRHHLATYQDSSDNSVYIDRYIRPNYKNSPHGLTVDLPSPDSGIGETTVTPRDSMHQIFDYAEIAPAQPILPPTDDESSNATSKTTPIPSPARKNSWNHEYGRNAELDKVQIPKIFSDVGFHYYLESPISTSQRREDDRMTYINKGQYYGITLEYIPDSDRPLRSCTVKSTVMLVFREEKSPEDELKAWKFWHSRQHSVKQRILDADTKNSCGIIGQIEEVTHNAIAFYWNPMEGPAKISVSVHCLSTDFSNQKGVKGFPLHIQIDTTDDLRENNAPPVHRGYCQIKVFCDKGAERKTRDEERRAAKRKLTATDSRKKIEEMYHSPCERSEFYSMSDLSKPPILFTPDDDNDKSNGPELTFYTITAAAAAAAAAEESVASIGELSFSSEVKSPLDIPISPPAKKFKIAPADRELTALSYWGSPVLLYVKRADEEIFHPLHLVPPTLVGLAKAVYPDESGNLYESEGFRVTQRHYNRATDLEVYETEKCITRIRVSGWCESKINRKSLENKYNISADHMRHFYKRCKKGITVIMDDDIIRLYSNEDTFILDIIKTEDNKYDITLVEL